MSLVPIIYTSLLIFSAFLLFVIIISYISYKAKSGDRLPAHLRNHIDPLGNRILLSPMPVNNYNVGRPISIQSSLPVLSAIRTSNAVNAQYSYDNYISAVNSTQRKSSHRKTYREEFRDKSYTQTYKKQLTKSVSDRLEIMNNSERFKTQVRESDSGNASARHYTSHGDVNLFNFYSDKSDLDLVTLSTPKVNRSIAI